MISVIVWCRTWQRYRPCVRARALPSVPLVTLIGTLTQHADMRSGALMHAIGWRCQR